MKNTNDAYDMNDLNDTNDAYDMNDLNDTNDRNDIGKATGRRIGEDPETEEILRVIEDEEKDNIRQVKAMEKLFGSISKGFMKAANPFKKFAFKTPCLMHKFINIQSVHILENEGYLEEADFYRDHIKALNEGATWIDQDFKSINHFYHHDKEKGLYGFSDALTEAGKYKDKLAFFAGKQNLTRSIFYAGVICHLIQDMTVPQHVNNQLLESHRDYEVWILSKAWDEIDFSVSSGIKRYPRFELYARENAKLANQVFSELKSMTDREEMYRIMATKLIAEAQYTTAGLLLDFYENYFAKLAKDNGEDQTTEAIDAAI